MGHIPNIDAISGALITLSLSILILNFQCEDGARNGSDIYYMGISKAKGVSRAFENGEIKNG